MGCLLSKMIAELKYETHILHTEPKCKDSVRCWCQVADSDADIKFNGGVNNNEDGDQDVM